MKTLFTSLILVFLIHTLLVSQEVNHEVNKKEELIRTFYRDIFGDIKSPEEIVREYVVYSDSNYQDAIKSVNYFRMGSSNNESFVIAFKKNLINNRIGLIGHNEFKEEDKAKFLKLDQKRLQDIYKLSIGDYPPIYVLLLGQKIESFFGFQKAGDNEYLFIIYH